MKNVKTLYLLALVLLNIGIVSAQTPCEDGMAGSYPCQGIDLLSHISAQDLLAEEQQGVWLNDIWGWTDPDTGKEYALIGMSNGTSFVDVTDPVNPIFLGLLNEHNYSGKSSEGSSSGRLYHDSAKSIWRDIKVYKNHAFIVSEDADHGMQIFDLTLLRGVTSPQTFTETAIYQGIGSAHNIVINEATGYAYAVGANTQDKTCTEGGLHIIDISTPNSPVYAGCFDTDGYTHDAQCVIYNGPDAAYQGMEICFNTNENSITLVNVDDKNNISMISKKDYTGVEYAHQGWLTEDHKYFLTNDELDELNNGTNTKTLIWDVQDLDNPVLFGTYEHDGNAIDHNLYIVDNLVYESNYTSGLQILSLDDIAQGGLSKIAYFDSYPTSNATSFDGTWSNYPFFESGTIILSDIINGLYVLKLSASTTPTSDFTYATTGNEVSFTNTSSDAYTYEWDFGDGSTSTEENPTHEYGLGGDYNVTLKTINHLGNNETTQSINIEFILPTPSFTYLIDVNVVSFTNTSLQALTYEWDFGDGSTSNKENPIHEYVQGGVYDVKLTATNSLGSNETIQNISFVYTSVSTTQAFTGLSLYPNPVTSQLNIDFGKQINQAIDITLIDLKGKVFLQKHISNGEAEFTIDTHHIPHGMYYLTLSSSEGRVTKKVIIN